MLGKIQMIFQNQRQSFILCYTNQDDWKLNHNVDTRVHVCVCTYICNNKDRLILVLYGKPHSDILSLILTILQKSVILVTCEKMFYMFVISTTASFHACLKQYNLVPGAYT
jgi:hypothetical protein